MLRSMLIVDAPESCTHFNYDHRVESLTQGQRQRRWDVEKTNMRISMFTPCPPNININLPRIKDAKHLRTTPMIMIMMMTQTAQNKPNERRHDDLYHDPHHDHNYHGHHDHHNDRTCALMQKTTRREATIKTKTKT
ncbi:hypothetical protein ACLKA7_014087 [Drosophila subpalustris]